MTPAPSQTLSRTDTTQPTHGVAQAAHVAVGKWPEMIWIVRHGQSSGNVARDAAEAAGLAVIDIADRDIDVPLSPLGTQQARALGEWIAQLPAHEQPEVVLASPYIRARDTARYMLQSAGLEGQAELRFDERLREKEFGILDRLTRFGIKERYPELDEQRGHVGKFYFRPPGGESWCDVILRLRSLMEMAGREYAGRRVVIIAHQVIVNCARYLLENMDEHQILEIDRMGDVPNCGVTSYQFDAGAGLGGGMVLRQANFVAPLTQAGTPVTSAPDVAAAAKP
ncbi:MAG: histidine phosphatase family protein [Comamonadaceae bacterium]|nr:MAG: histidine phosphatase family protein [Comamonadaceae bacterium]